MIRRLLHAILDHEVTRLRERNRELEEEIVACRQNTNTVIREQNDYINRVREDAEVAQRDRDVWRDAARRIATDLGADLKTKVDDLDPSWPGFVITRAIERIWLLVTVRDRARQLYEVYDRPCKPNGDWEHAREFQILDGELRKLVGAPPSKEWPDPISDDNHRDPIS